MFDRCAIQICQNGRFINSPLYGNNTITFWNIWAIFTRKHQSRVTSERTRIKDWENLFNLHSSCQLPAKSFDFQHIQFCGYRSQWKFLKNHNLDFQVWLLFLVPRLHFWKNEISWSRFYAESISNNFKSKNWKKKKLVFLFYSET